MWKLIEPLEDGVPVVFVGVHALRWRPEWGEPRVGFIQADDNDAWLPYPENKPSVSGLYDVTSEHEYNPNGNPFVSGDYYDVDIDKWKIYGNLVIAYRTRPAPYRKD